MTALRLPEHLAHLRELLAAAKVGEAIAVLERPEYDADADALLVLARCLAFQQRFDDAAAVYDRAAGLSSALRRDAALGKAHALLGAGRAIEALLLFDQSCADAPGDLEPIEGRALALRHLGRDAEADEVERKVITASGERSRLGVNSRA